mmetsp:Transcript_9745/g.36627  ORF Transcript_9745/g.36627 Transcript_9745/m.36627 type:complete len:202 (+) Transcript_9745:2800-3405(+)
MARSSCVSASAELRPSATGISFCCAPAESCGMTSLMCFAVRPRRPSKALRYAVLAAMCSSAALREMPHSVQHLCSKKLSKPQMGHVQMDAEAAAPMDVNASASASSTSVTSPNSGASRSASYMSSKLSCRPRARLTVARRTRLNRQAVQQKQSSETMRAKSTNTAKPLQVASLHCVVVLAFRPQVSVYDSLLAHRPWSGHQ